MGARLRGSDLAILLAVVAVWGYTFVPIKVALLEVPPLALAALRFFFAAVPMVLLVRPPAIPPAYVIAYGAAIGVFQFGLLFVGMQLGMPAGLSSLVIQVQVFFTIALAALFAGDVIARHHVLGAAVAGGGIAVLAWHKLQAGPGATFTGFVLVVAAALAWGIGNVIAKRAAADHRADSWALAVWSSLVAPVPLAILSYVFEGGAAAVRAVVGMSAVGWTCVLFMAYGSTLFAYAAWNRLLHRYPTAVVSPFALLIPVSGIASGVLFLGESLAPVQALGALLVLAGLSVTVFGTRIGRFARRMRGA
jgi:O-acetylserine/cysteine efflux transporter